MNWFQIHCLLTVMSEQRNGKTNGDFDGATTTRFIICRCFAFSARKPTYSWQGLASVHLAPDVAVSIMHSNHIKLKCLLCLCNQYACDTSARVTHRTRTRVLPQSACTSSTSQSSTRDTGPQVYQRSLAALSCRSCA